MRCDMKTCRHNERGYCTNKIEREVCVEVAERVLIEKYPDKCYREMIETLRTRCKDKARDFFDKRMFGCLTIVTLSDLARNEDDGK